MQEEEVQIKSSQRKHTVASMSHDWPSSERVGEGVWKVLLGGRLTPKACFIQVQTHNICE